ncbi:MAG: peptide-methionine (S)-S-oxide reductase MsrA [Planctomycetota bacterium]
MKSSPHDSGKPTAPAATATFGAGCYWCVEAVLERLDGVLDVRSGFMGGSVPDPSYEAVCSGETGHAEVVQVDFDPARVSFDELLGWFWQLHDPTTLNRQGADYGTQYRSVIFFHDDTQREQALASKAKAQAEFAEPIVTEISPASTFYEAKGEHQDFYRNNPAYGYCRVVIRPKMKKLGLEK